MAVGAPGGIAERLAAPNATRSLFLVVAISYALGAEAAQRWFDAGVGLAFYPPAGVTIAALVLVPPRRWWVVLLAAAAAETGIGLAHGLELAPSVGYAAANVVEPVVGATVLAWAVLRTGRRRLDLLGRTDLARFVGCAAVVGPLVGAIIATAVASADSGTSWWQTVAHWWVGDGLGVVVVGSTLVLHVAGNERPLRSRWEWTALLVAAAAVSVLTLFVWDLPPLVLLLPVLVWAVFRFDVHGVVLVGLVYATAAGLATASGRGEFAGIPNTNAATRLGMTQASIAIVVLTGWIFAIEVRERLRAIADREAALRDQYRFEVLGAAGEVSASMAGAATTGDVLWSIRKHVNERLGADDVGLARCLPEDAAVGPHDIALGIPETNSSLVVRWADEPQLADLDRDYLGTVAAVVGMALERVQLHELVVIAAAEAEHARADAEREAERLELAVEAATILVYDVDLDHQTVSTSGLRHLLGVDDSVTSIESWRARLHPDDADEHLRVWIADQASGASRTLGYRIRHRDGSWREVEDSRRFLEGPPGRRVIGALRDLTDQRAEQRRTRTLANLSDALAAGAPETDDLTSLLEAIARAAVPGFAERCCVHMVAGQVTLCRARAIADDVGRSDWCPLGRPAHWDTDGSMVARAVRARCAISDASALCVPVVIDHEVRVVIEFDLGAEASYSYTVDDVALATEFGRRCAAIVQEVLLRSAAEEARREALAAATEQSAGRVRAERLQRAGAVVAGATDTAGVLVAIEAASDDLVASRASRLVTFPSVSPLSALDGELVHRVVTTGETAVRWGPAPGAAVPLRAGSADVAAVVVIDLVDEPDDGVRGFLTDVGRQWSESLARAVAYDLQHIAVARTTALQSITAGLAAATSIDDVRQVVALAGPLLGASVTTLDDTDVPRATATPGTTVVPCPSGTGEAQFALVVQHDREHLDDDDARLLSTVGELVGQACTRVSLAEREHMTAVQLQQAMLGHPDPVWRLDTGVAYRAAEAGLEIGGDWYDVVDLGERSAACIVGDVVGHSLSAATAMGQLRSAGRALAPIASDPADLIERIEQFAGSVREARYTTLAVVFVDIDQGLLRYACAGHLPPLLVHQDGTAEYLMGARGMPLAGATGIVRTWAEAPIRPGDLLVLYTDGLVERRDETIDDGLERLMGVVAAHRDLATDALCAAVVDTMLEGRSPNDDVAMLVARPVATRFEHGFRAEPSELVPFRRSLRRWLEQLGIDEIDICDVLIAVGEGAANAVEHAYLERPRGTVHVTVEFEGGGLRSTIRDDGSWRVVPASGNRGRGTGIMRAVAHRVGLDAETGGTTVVIDHRLAASGRAGTR